MSEDDAQARRLLLFRKALDWIERLKKEPFNESTEEKLVNHPFLLDAEKDTLSMNQKRSFVCQQLYIQRSDAISFAYLAGHVDFRPKSLLNVSTPPPPTSQNNSSYKGYKDLFQFLLEGELYAATLLLDHAEYLGLGRNEHDIIQQAASSGRDGGGQRQSALAQAYPSYWSRIALGKHRAAGAAACAVNFPAWGRMCSRLATAYQNSDKTLQQQATTNNKNNSSSSSSSSSSAPCKELAFIQFFATPIDNLNEMAAAVMMQELEKDTTISYEEIAEHVRLLQEYELLFWDACYNSR